MHVCELIGPTWGRCKLQFQTFSSHQRGRYLQGNLPPLAVQRCVEVPVGVLAFVLFGYFQTKVFQSWWSCRPWQRRETSLSAADLLGWSKSPWLKGYYGFLSWRLLLSAPVPVVPKANGALAWLATKPGWSPSDISAANVLTWESPFFISKIISN